MIIEYKNTLLATKMETWNGQSGYEEWTEDLEYHIMGLGLNETNNAVRMLGLFHPDSSHIGFDGSRTNSLAGAAQNAIAEIGHGCLN